MTRLTRWTSLALVLAGLAWGTRLQAGMIANYHFDETTGGIAYDSVGAANGTLQGGAAFVGGGISGGAISLTKATQSLVNMGDNFNFSSAFSIQAWVKLETGYTGGEIVVSRHWAGNVSGYFLAVNEVADGCSADGKAHFYSAYPCSGTSATSINDGQWHQLVGVFNSGNASLYVDGALESSSGGSTVLTPIAAAFLVGGAVVGGTPLSTFDGLVDEVGVWDTALTAAEVQGLYSGLTTTTPEPAAWTVTLGALIALARIRRSRRAS